MRILRSQPRRSPTPRTIPFRCAAAPVAGEVRILRVTQFGPPIFESLSGSARPNIHDAMTTLVAQGDQVSAAASKAIGNLLSRADAQIFQGGVAFFAPDPDRSDPFQKLNVEIRRLSGESERCTLSLSLPGQGTAHAEIAHLMNVPRILEGEHLACTLPAEVTPELFARLAPGIEAACEFAFQRRSGWPAGTLMEWHAAGLRTITQTLRPAIGTPVEMRLQVANPLKIDFDWRPFTVEVEEPKATRISTHLIDRLYRMLVDFLAETFAPPVSLTKPPPSAVQKGALMAVLKKLRYSSDDGERLQLRDSALSLIQQKTGLNETDALGQMPLFLILDISNRALRAEMLGAFVKAGGSIFRTNPLGLHPTIKMIEEGDNDCLEILLAANADPDLTSVLDACGLEKALANKNHRGVDLLLARKAQVNRKTVLGKPLLFIAIGSHDLNLVKKMRQAGARLDLTDALGRDAKKYAQLYGTAQISHYLNAI